MKAFFGGKTDETTSKTATSQRPRSDPGQGGERVHGHVLTDEDIRRDQERRVCTLAEALQEKVEESDRLYHKLDECRQQCRTLEEAAVVDKKRIEELEARVKKLEEQHASDVVCVPSFFFIFHTPMTQTRVPSVRGGTTNKNRSSWRRSMSVQQSCRRPWLQ